MVDSGAPLFLIFQRDMHARICPQARQRIVAADIASAVVTFRPHQRTSRCGLSASGGSTVINKQVEKRPGDRSEQWST